MSDNELSQENKNLSIHNVIKVRHQFWNDLLQITNEGRGMNGWGYIKNILAGELSISLN